MDTANNDGEYFSRPPASVGKTNRWLVNTLDTCIQLVHLTHWSYVFRKSLSDCLPKLNLSAHLLTSNFTSWNYQTSKELKSSSFSGQISSYGGGGYVQDLAFGLEGSTSIVQELMNNRWIDRGTRGVFIDFTVYNANINLFCVIRYDMTS